jgi:3-dehydroquinate synthase
VEVVNLDLGGRGYPIYIGAGLLQQSELLARHIRGKQVLIVTNETIAPLYLNQVQSALTDFKVDSVILPDGEAHKNLTTLNLIFDALLENQHNRQSTIIALGGGVVGDMAGFAAASYQRGIDFIQMPTTLLSQVDSSVGGKTAVNHPLGKNMIGAFYQPKAVVIDVDTLRTLPGRELSAGLAEVIKHGALANLAYFDWVEENLGAILAGDKAAQILMIKGSCEIKAMIVAEDKRESGVRALLNLGHTFGHAIENGLGYGQWLHGEAVGAGLVMAADLSCRLGMLGAAEGIRLKRLVAASGLPVAPPPELSDSMLKLMARDKKATDDGLRFVLLEQLGKACLRHDVDESQLASTLKAGAGLLEPV